MEGSQFIGSNVVSAANSGKIFFFSVSNKPPLPLIIYSPQKEFELVNPRRKLLINRRNCIFLSIIIYYLAVSTGLYPAAGFSYSDVTTLGSPDPAYSATSLASASILYNSWFAQSKPGQLFGLQGEICMRSTCQNTFGQVNYSSSIDARFFPFPFLIREDDV